MTFTPGQSGNPSGRPRGIIDKRSSLRGLLDAHAKDLIEKLVDMAKQGDPIALKLCIERLLPRAKPDDSITFDLPQGPLNEPSNMLKNTENITRAVANGDMSIDEANKLTAFIDLQRDNIDNIDL